jgi:hypothetical protein
MAKDPRVLQALMVFEGGAARYRRRLLLCARAVRLLCLAERSPELDGILIELQALAVKPTLTLVPDGERTQRAPRRPCE